MCQSVLIGNGKLREIWWETFHTWVCTAGFVHSVAFTWKKYCMIWLRNTQGFTYQKAARINLRAYVSDSSVCWALCSCRSWGPNQCFLKCSIKRRTESGTWPGSAFVFCSQPCAIAGQLMCRSPAWPAACFHLYLATSKFLTVYVHRKREPNLGYYFFQCYFPSFWYGCSIFLLTSVL